MDAQQNDELYPIAVLIDELKVGTLKTTGQEALLIGIRSMMMSCFA